MQVRKAFGAASPLWALIVLASGFWLTGLPAMAQSDVAVAHFSSLELLGNSPVGASNRSAFSKAVQELNGLLKQRVPVRLAVVTGTIGVQQTLRGIPGSNAGCPSSGSGDQSGWFPSAKVLSDIVQNSNVPVWLFLPGRGDLLSDCPDNLLAFHQLLAEAHRRSSTARGPEIIDLSQQSSFSVDGWDILGLDSSSFDSDKPAGLERLSRLRDALHASSSSRILIAASWPRVGDPYASFPGHLRPGWPLQDTDQANWSEVIRNPRVQAVVSGDWQTTDGSAYSDFHGLFPDGFLSADLTKLYVSPPLGLAGADTEGTIRRGFEILRLMNNGRVLRTFYWFVADAFHSDPLSDFNRLIDLGDAYQRAGRPAEAEAAYLRALELKDAPDREMAFRKLNRVLTEWPLGEWWREHRLTIALCFVLGTFVLIGLLISSKIWHRRRRLRVYSLDAPDRADVPSAHLERLVEQFIGRMRFYASKVGPIDDTKLPFVWLGFAEGLGSTLEELLSSAPPAILGWMVGRMFRPRF